MPWVIPICRVLGRRRSPSSGKGAITLLIFSSRPFCPTTKFSFLLTPGGAKGISKDESGRILLLIGPGSKIDLTVELDMLLPVAICPFPWFISQNFFCSCTLFFGGWFTAKTFGESEKNLRNFYEVGTIIFSFFAIIVVKVLWIGCSCFFYHFCVGKFHFRRSGTSGKISELSRKSAFGNWLMPQDWREISRGQDRNPEKMTHFKKTSMRTSPLKFENCSRPFWCTYEKQLRTHFGGVSLAFPCIHYSELLSKWGGWREGRLV